MAPERLALTANEEAELERLCEEYTAATMQVRKTLRVGNPPEPERVIEFLKQEARVAEIIERIKEVLGVGVERS